MSDEESTIQSRMAMNHFSINAYRTAVDQNNPREAALARVWVHENMTSEYANVREPIISKICRTHIANGTDRSNPSEYAWGSGLGAHPFPFTQEHATVAATLFQWLGSNIGLEILTRALADAGYRVEKIR